MRTDEVDKHARYRQIREAYTADGRGTRMCEDVSESSTGYRIKPTKRTGKWCINNLGVPADRECSLVSSVGV